MYAPTQDTACAFHLDGWHSHPGCVCVLLSPPGHSHGLVYCQTCRVAADLEAVGVRITLASSGRHAEKKEGAR